MYRFALFCGVHAFNFELRFCQPRSCAVAKVGAIASQFARRSTLHTLLKRHQSTFTNMSDLNVLGGKLQCCCNSPKTGFYRDGYCRTGSMDTGRHTVCAVVTQDFLEYSRSLGNDLITPMSMYQFPGLNPGDKWCLCVSRWKQAYDAGCAPKVVLEASHAKALDVVTLAQLKEHAIPAE
eukprot:TRINITY_DN4767_c0_g1_i1.p1 TRINITY_DN4767_c0_g1~~TRINITY_DN4767_c0_g1_i1.p1  ORF type:complete len:179 (+),score=9.98 TRINITY_DN4767_c0_g1_i1:215-751(+)